MIIEESALVNSLGQEIQVGDPVVFIASGYNKSVYIFKGTYAGIKKGSTYYGRAIEIAVVKDIKDTYKKWDPVTKTYLDKERVRTSYLPRKRVYHADTSLADFINRRIN